MATLFISDLHLSPERPEIVRLFGEFLAGPARSAEALYILGDLFEYWAGDDDLANAFNTSIVAALAACARSIPVTFMRGNRDFLVAERFAHQSRMRIAEDPEVVQLYGRRVLVSHGDTLCTDDSSYQQFRRMVRSPAWTESFLKRPLAERRREIERLRALSEAEKQGKPASVMDVNPRAVEHLLRQHGYPTLVHGHTHRPARHEHVVDGHACERWVLADWYRDASWLAVGPEGFGRGMISG